MTEAVAATHRIDIIHCDININNLLLNKNLTVKLCNFQRQLFQLNETVNKDRFVQENIKSFML